MRACTSAGSFGEHLSMAWPVEHAHPYIFYHNKPKFQTDSERIPEQTFKVTVH